jgi:hypothetical protein
MSSNVIRMPTARPSDAGQPTALKNPIAALIAVIDQALGENWSFDLVHHEVVGDETIVFARLVVDGRHRVGIGGTTRQGPLVDRLNDAALDALTRAAAWMGIQTAAPATTPQPTSEPVPTAPAESTARITRKQLDYAIGLARDRGIARDRLVATCLAEFGRKPEYLTRAEASTLIESLKKEAA